MENKIKVISERVDDIPLLLAEIDRMGLTQIMDIHFPSHGNWAGLNLGAVSSIWLSHILSEGDHRLNHVQAWAEHRLESLSRCIGTAVRGLDFSDDRLGLILNRLSKDDPWDEFERELNRRVMAALATRAFVVKQQNYYLCPLPKDY